MREFFHRYLDYWRRNWRIKVSTVAYKRTISDISFLTLWNNCRVHYLYHIVLRRHKALMATTQGDFVTHNNKSLSVTLLPTRFGVQRFHERRHSDKPLFLCSPRAALLSGSQAWQRRTVQFAAAWLWIDALVLLVIVQRSLAAWMLVTGFLKMCPGRTGSSLLVPDSH